jgi:hypothetical protein
MGQVNAGETPLSGLAETAGKTGRRLAFATDFFNAGSGGN